jgi:hypothetical protein
MEFPGQLNIPLTISNKTLGDKDCEEQLSN